MNSIVAKIKYKWRCLSTDFLCRMGFRAILLKERPGNRVLLYHGIDSRGRTDLNGRFLGVAQFEAQIRYFKEHFHLLSLTDLFYGKTLSGQLNIALAFDDGYRNNLSLALPILENIRPQLPFLSLQFRTPGSQCFGLIISTWQHRFPVQLSK